MKKIKAVVIVSHLLTWIVLSIAYFYLVEPIIKRFSGGSHDIGLWISFELIGLIINCS